MGAELLRREGRVGTTACFAILHPAHSAVGNWATGTPVFQVPVFPGPGFPGPGFQKLACTVGRFFGRRTTTSKRRSEPYYCRVKTIHGCIGDTGYWTHIAFFGTTSLRHQNK